MSELFKALHKFQGRVAAVHRDASNPHFRSRYATLENVCDTIRPAMQECGLVWMQMPGATSADGLALTTVIAHAESGEARETTMIIPLAARTPQGVGSALTYGMRYSLMAALGIPPTDDDDGNEGSKTAPKPQPKANSREPYERLQSAIRSFDKSAALKGWWESDAVKDEYAALPNDWKKLIKDEVTAKAMSLKSASADDFPGDNQSLRNMMAG